MTYIVAILVCLAVFSILVIAQMYVAGGVYRRPLNAQDDALWTFTCALPRDVKKSLRDVLANENRTAKRVNISGWKAGKTVQTSAMSPCLIAWYRSFASHVAGIVGEPLHITPLTMPTSMCILIYDQEGDHINWHYDTNYYDGRFFTVLIPLTDELTSTQFVYRDGTGTTRALDLVHGASVVFEGERVFHTASKLGSGQRRVVLSLQYTTDPCVSWWNRLLMRVKDAAYV